MSGCGCAGDRDFGCEPAGAVEPGQLPGRVLPGLGCPFLALAMGVGRFPERFVSRVEANEPGPGCRPCAAVSLGQPQVSRCEFRAVPGVPPGAGGTTGAASRGAATLPRMSQVSPRQSTSRPGLRGAVACSRPSRGPAIRPRAALPGTVQRLPSASRLTSPCRRRAAPMAAPMLSHADSSAVPMRRAELRGPPVVEG